MRIWASKNSEVPVREQIATQVRVGIASRDLLPGDKLPSIRELARRCGIHPNTVSAAYRDLVAEGILERRTGSGVFVNGRQAQEPPGSVEEIVADLVSLALSAGYDRPAIESAMSAWMRQGAKRQIAVVESDIGLRNVLVTEIEAATGLRVCAISLEEYLETSGSSDIVFAALFDEKEKMAWARAARTTVFLDVNSVPRSLVGNRRPAVDDLVAVVSGWKQFASLAQLYLLAAKIDLDSVMIIDPCEDGWLTRVSAASMIICDSHSAGYFENDARVRVFRLVSDESIERLRYAIA